MSSGELLLILFVSVIVFTPQKLPMLAKHLAKCAAFFAYTQQQWVKWWQSLLAQQQLEDNLKKAALAEERSSSDKDTL